MGGSAPPWTSTVVAIAGAFQHSGGPTTGDAEDTALGPPGKGSTTAGTTGGGTGRPQTQPPSAPSTSSCACPALRRSPPLRRPQDAHRRRLGHDHRDLLQRERAHRQLGRFATTTAASFTITSPTTIKATSPAHAAGTVKIKVTTTGGVVTSSSNYKFT